MNFEAQIKQIEERLRPPPPPPGPAPPEPVAIIGLAGYFPQCMSVREFWRALDEDRCLLEEIPVDRFDWRGIYDPSGLDPNKTRSKWGGFIPDIRGFDPGFFKVSVAEAKEMDPQLRLLLMAVYHALEDAGHSPESLRKSRTGVFIAGEESDYMDLRRTRESAFGEGAGESPHQIANAVSHYFDFNGPSEFINTLCSGGAIALNRAVRSLRTGESSTALVGAVNLLLRPEPFVAMSGMNLLSSAKEIHSFGREAAGHLRADGVAAVLLKPLTRAEADGDPIYAIIRNTAVNHNGRGAVSRTAPDPGAHADVIRACYEPLGLDPRRLGYIEAQGMGNPLSDIAEWRAFNQALVSLSEASGLQVEPGSCVIGCLKPLAGHMEAASSLGALFKIIHGFRTRTRFGIHGFSESHPELQQAGQPCALAGQKSSWPGGGLPRVAGLHAHGMGGNNAHILLEEYPAPPQITTPASGLCLVVLSAPTKEKLGVIAKNLLDWLLEGRAASLDDLAFTLQVGRDAMSHRLALVVDSLETLQTGLAWRGAPAGAPPVFLCEGEADRLNGDAPGFHDLEELARFWVSGGHVAWRRMPRKRPARRVSLPGYPFEKQACWLDDPPPRAVSASKGSASAEKVRARLKSVLAGELGVGEDEVDAGRHFMDYGLGSLAAMRLTRQLGAFIGAPVRLRDWLEHPTIESLSGFLAARDLGGAQTEASPPSPAQAFGRRDQPLSHCQRGIWALQKTQPQSTVYNVPLCFRVAGRVGAGAFRTACRALLCQHPLLACSILEKDGALLHVPSAADPLLEEFELSPSETDNLPKLLEDRLRVPFQLEKGPLIRFHLAHCAGPETVVLLVVHHLVVDGLSAAPLMRTLLDAYLECSRGGQPQLTPAPADFADFVQWEKDSLAHESGRLLKNYWQRQLSGAPASIPLVAERPPDSEKGRGASHSVVLPGQLWRGLKDLARARRVSLPTVFLAVFKTMLRRYSGEDDIIVGVVTQVRPDERFNGHVGYFINLLPVRTREWEGRAFGDLLPSLQELLTDAIDHAAYPFPLMVRDAGPGRSADPGSFVQVGFEYQTYVPAEDLARRYESVLSLRQVEEPRQTGEFELALEVVELADAVALHFKYDRGTFAPEAVIRMGGHYLVLASGAVANPEGALSTFPMLDKPEWEGLLKDWNNTRQDYPEDQCAHDLIARAALRQPDRVAVSTESQSLTYAELDRRATALAGYLQDLGVRPDEPVAVCVDRSPEMVVALLGIMKSGGAYLPLDPGYPPGRLAYIVRDSHARLIVTQTRLTPTVRQWKTEAGNGSLQTIIEIDGHWSEVQRNETGKPPLRPVSPDHLAYVIYTSGSTGNPKGVMIPHRALTNFLVSMSREPGVGPGDRLLAVTTLSFDIAGLELFLPLIQGAECRLCASSTAGDAERLRETIRRSGPTVMQATPSTWKMLFRAGWTNEERVRILCGGEALPEDLAATFINGGMEAWNLYGPTETTIWSTLQRVERGAPAGIGRPIANTRIYILDRAGQPVPVGVAGEILIAGDGLARGYWNQPALTETKFVELSFPPGERAYKTGDVGCWREDGSIGYLGRGDHQIKLRGHRIELEEIEHQMARHPEVRDAAVVVRQHLETRQLVAYYAPKSPGNGKAQNQRSSLEAHLKRSLPAYMVPAFFIPLPELPLTPNGKKDRKALAAREIQLSESKPESEAGEGLEGQVLGLWRNLLGVANIGPLDAFFTVGGDSVSAVMLADRITRTFGTTFTTTDLFRHPTARAITTQLALATRLATDPAPSKSLDLDSATRGDGQTGGTPDYYKESLAIIGMSCEFPGSETPAEFWAGLTAGVDSAVFYSEADLQRAGVPDEIARKPGFVPVGRALKGKEFFDPDFFKIPAKNAALMDPQFRLLLMHSWKAVEDAGYIPADLPDAAVFTAVGNTFYAAGRINAASDLYDGENYVAWLMAQEGTVATMISYQLGLKGPSHAVHANCSSSLVALHTAWQTIRLGEASCALVGAASALPDSKIGYQFQEGMNFSSDGRCRAFDAGADGMTGGEGVAVLLVKRADLAARDGDHIYALVRGVGVNNDGSDKIGFYAPGASGQSDVIEKVLQSTGVHPDSIGYVEAHGTGTKLGDPVEAAALIQAYRQHTSRRQYCGLGSVKSNLGHLDTAAGLAGCVKVALGLFHGIIPPTLHYKAPNPAIDFANSPFYVADQLRAWPRENGPRRAGLSSLGIGGTNTHAILEEHIPAPSTSAQPQEGPALVPLSARDGSRLRDVVRNLLEWIRGQPPDAPVADLAFTLQAGRVPMPHRLAAIAQSMGGLAAQLERVMFGGDDLAGLPADLFSGVALEAAAQKSGAALEGVAERPADGETLVKLAKAWVNGATIPWAQLHQQRRPRRISLPTYPFARERFGPPSIKVPAAQNSSNRLHPLLHENISTLAGHRYRTTFTGAEFFLADHRVRGRPMLPGVAYLEMARAAVARATGGAAQPVLKNVAWLRSFEIEAEPREVFISLRAGAGEEIHFEISTTANLLCQGDAIPGKSIASPLAPPKAPHPSPIASRHTAEECYRACAELGIDYGPGHQAITELYAGENEVLAKLVFPTSLADTLDQFVLHPSLLDAAVHASIGFHLRERGPDGKVRSLLLPFALDSLDIPGACRPEMWARITKATADPAHSISEKVTIELCDNEGAVQVRLSGLFSRKPAGGEPAGSTGSTDVWLARAVWRPAPPSSSATRTGFTQARVMLCDLPAAREIAPNSAGEEKEWLVVESGNACPAGRFSEIATAVLGEIRRLLEAKPARDTLMQVVIPERPDSWALRGLSGLLESASLENPRLFTQLIGVDAGWSRTELKSILDENRRSPGAIGIRYHQGAREVSRLEDFPAAEFKAGAPWRQGGVYLITGGAGALGLLFAREIGRRAPGATVVLAGRAESSPKLLERLKALGARCEYRRCDAAKRGETESLIAGIRDEFGPLAGVIHAAGVIDDDFILRKSAGNFERVLAPKVAGAVNLDHAIGSAALDFFVVFGSLAGVLGSPGQSDYSAANAFLDAFAEHRHTLVAAGTRHGRTLCLAWPLWRDGGMKVDEAMARETNSRTGFLPMDTEAGLQAFDTALAATEARAAVMSGHRDRIQAFLAARETRRPSHDQATRPADDQSGRLASAALEWLRAEIAAGLERPAHRLKNEEKFERYGVDSILAVQLTNRLEGFFGSLPKTLFFEYQSLPELAGFLIESHREKLRQLTGVESEPSRPAPAPEPVEPEREVAAPMPRQASRQDGIAIIGLSGRYPQANNLAEFWSNLENGRDSITEVPADRWDWRNYYTGDPKQPGHHAGKWGGFIEDADKFDPLFFNLSPREAQLVDPQERLFLETVWNLLEAAGYTRKRLQERHQGRVAVYAASMYQQYHSFRSDEVSEALVSLSSFSGIANRVSYYFDFQGPSIAVDTMCSSSFVAIKMACDSLQNGEVSLAVAGGVNLSIHPHKFTGLSAAKLMGSHPGSRSFADGDGYLPSEGVGAVLLKPLADAVRDGDPILAVIKAVTNQHSGQSGGFGVPNPQAQAQAVEECLRRSGIDPRTIGYIESAANGSPLGDAIEVKALSAAFGKHVRERGVIPIGSVKSNMGHAEAASGMAQLTKVVLQMKHRRLAPNIIPPARNPNINFEDSPFRFQETLSAWDRPVVEAEGGRAGQPRRAMIHSVGAGGSTAHLVLEEFIPDESNPAPDVVPTGPVIITVSARTRERLGAQIQNLRNFLAQNPDDSLPAIARTLQLGREAMDHRAALVAASRESLLEGLDGLAERLQTGGETSLRIPAFLGNADETDPAVRSIFSGPAGEMMIGELVRRRELEKLAVLWTQGGEIPWSGLYNERPFRMTNLPTYPFERRRCWVSGPDVTAEPPPRRPARTETPPPDGRNGNTVHAFLRVRIQEMLGLKDEELPSGKPLHTLGFNSIDGVTLKSALEQAFEVEIPVSTFNAYHSLDQITGEVVGLVGARTERRLPGAGTTGSGAAGMQPALAANLAERYLPFPLSEIQESFLMGRKPGARDQTGCHVYFEIDLPELDVFRLNTAWNRLVRRHEMLRAVILPEGSQQILEETAPYRFQTLDLRRSGEAERAAAMEGLRRRMSHQVYDPARWPLFEIRVSLLPDRRIIHFSIDELIVDALSIDILFQEWKQLYDDPGASLPDLELSFRDYVLAARAFAASERARKDMDYWLAKLRQMPAGPRLAGFDTGIADSGAASRQCVRLEGKLGAAGWSALKRKAESLDASPTALVLALFIEVLRSRSREKAFSLILTFFNRRPVHPQVGQILGPFISTSIFVAEDPSEQPLEANVRKTQQRLWEDLDHNNVSGIRVLRELRRRRTGPDSPALPVVFTSMLGARPGNQETLLKRLSYSVTQTPQVSLDHQLYELEGGLVFSWDVVKEHFTGGVVEALFQDYCQVLESLAATPERWETPLLLPVHEPESDPSEAQLAAHPGDYGKPFPLTDQQQAYAFGRSEHGSLTPSNVLLEFVAEGLDAKRLEGAWRRVVETHSMLATTIQTDGSQKKLPVIPPYSVGISDFTTLEGTALDEALDAVGREMSARICPLGGWPFFELRLSKLPLNRCRVHLCVDMIAADGASIDLLAQELLDAYANPLAKPRIPAIAFQDCMRADRELRKTRAYDDAVNYWNGKFGVIPSGPALPRADTLPEPGTYRLSAVVQGWDRLKARAQALAVPPARILLTAFAEILWLWSGKQPFTVAVPCWHRPPLHPDIHRVVGDFTTLCWLAVDAMNRPFQEEVVRHHHAIQLDIAHRAVSGLRALRKLGAKNGNRARLSFPVVFTDLSPQPPLRLPPGFKIIGSSSQTSHVHLDNMSAEMGGQLEIHWDLARGVYPEPTARTMFGHYHHLLTALAHDETWWARADLDSLILGSRDLPGKEIADARPPR